MECSDSFILGNTGEIFVIMHPKSTSSVGGGSAYRCGITLIFESRPPSPSPYPILDSKPICHPLPHILLQDNNTPQIAEGVAVLGNENIQRRQGQDHHNDRSCYTNRRSLCLPRRHSRRHHGMCLAMGMGTARGTVMGWGTGRGTRTEIVMEGLRWGTGMRGAPGWAMGKGLDCHWGQDLGWGTLHKRTRGTCSPPHSSTPAMSTASPSVCSTRNRGVASWQTCSPTPTGSRDTRKSQSRRNLAVRHKGTPDTCRSRARASTPATSTASAPD
mmetsp:Transcript_105227/g.177825  ORF Transcript_105227/g.177825 Transcript_105227/m.177825 type:complete len:272 (-) Transcript_105227:1135-1950(-)